MNTLSDKLVENSVNEGFADLFDRVRWATSRGVKKVLEKLSVNKIPKDAQRYIQKIMIKMRDEIKENVRQKLADNPGTTQILVSFDKYFDKSFEKAFFGTDKLSKQFTEILWHAYFFSDKGQQDWHQLRDTEDANLYTSDTMFGVYFSTWVMGYDFEDFKTLFVEMCTTIIVNELIKK